MPELLKNDKLDLIISGINGEGKGIARTSDDFVVFVDHTVPGDKVKAEIKKVKKNYAEANVKELLQCSPNRVEPECGHFGTCNGCKLQNTNYIFQLEIKRQNVIDAFERIGGFHNIDVPAVLGSDNTYFYRNKLEFSFSNNRWLTEEDAINESHDRSFALGFHMPNYVDKVLDIKKCYLQSELSNKILNLTRDFFKSRNESIYSTRTHTGYLRFLVIRQAANTNDLLVNLITSTENDLLMNEYASLLKKKVPQVTTFVNGTSTTKAQVARSDKSKIFFGEGCITELIGDYKFKISNSSFFQTNSLQSKKLFDTVISLADFSKDDNVLDLYCGAGVISIYISGFVNSITGIELSDESISAARENCIQNNVSNCEFITSDVKEYLYDNRGKTEAKYDTIIIDPPRSGLHPKCVEYIMDYAPEKIIYVSCNPATQARDVSLLSEKYNINGIQPVDMFPHTFHIENVVRLDKK